MGISLLRQVLIVPVLRGGVLTAGGSAQQQESARIRPLSIAQSPETTAPHNMSQQSMR